MIDCKVMKAVVKIADIVIILFVMIIIFFTAFFVYFKPQENSLVLIRGYACEWSYPVDAQETVFISGPLGDTIVRINERQAWIESSPCDNQTCVAAGIITRQGQWAACLPNNVLLMIYGVRDNDVDIVVW
jgi:hypothetical protein